MNTIQQQSRPAVGRLLATSAASAIAAALIASGAAHAQGSSGTVEQVVVTGTSIRGVAPVGSNVISVNREEIEKIGAQSMAEVLRTVPAVTGFGNTGQGSFGTGGEGVFAPTIHSLGASASNGTLILIDGHRLPLTGVNHNLVDPSVIAPNALERVEVLPEGASSTYGSDAVAGVLNFITRRRFNGLDLTAQAGLGDQYKTANFGFVGGRTWETGSALLAYNYSFRSSIPGDARDFNRADLRDEGGGTFQTFFCGPATFQGGAGNLIYTFPYTAGAGVASTAPGVCDSRRIADLVPTENRHSVLAKFEQEIGDRLKISADLVYSNRLNKQRNALSTVTATVFGPGSTPLGGAGQINPFYQGLAGATSGTYRVDFNNIFPDRRPVSKAGQQIFFATLGAEYDLGSEWQLTVGGTAGQNSSTQRGNGDICVPCAQIGLNGTVNQAGNPNTIVFPAVGGRASTVTQFPLTTANSVDIWNLGTANRTSAAVLQQLFDNADYQHSTHTITNLRAKVDGPVFALPGGDVRVAVGVEGILYGMRQIRTRNGPAGPGSVSATTSDLNFNRTVKAAFGELLIPIIGDDNAIPLVKKFDLNLAVRRDEYDDFGSTTNPKVAFDWEMFDGFYLRGNWGTSFTAPMLSPSRGERGTGRTGESGYALYTGTQTVPLSFPGASNLPGCTATGCVIGPVVQGIQVSGGNPNLKPMEGENSSFGVDYRSNIIQGLRVSATYWTAKYTGLITAPTLPAVLTTPGLYDAFIINPTPAQIAAYTGGLPQTGPLPTTISFIYDFRNRNAFNLNAAGVDFEISYRFSTDLGDFTLRANATRKTKFDQQAGEGAPWIDRLNTSGVNTTFSSLDTHARLSADYSRGPWSASADVTYVGDYMNLNGQAPFPVTTVGSVVTGGQHVKANKTLDLRLAYAFESEGWSKDASVYVDVNNVFDTEPPFVNANGGYSGSDANPIGRVVTVGVRKKW